MTNNLRNPTTAAFLTSPVSAATRHSLPWLASAAVLLAAVAPAAYAEPGNPLNDTFSVSLGTFLLNTKTKLRVDGQTTTGSEFDADRDLGLNDSDRFRVDAYWRMTPRQKIRAMYFNTDNSATKVLERNIEFNDVLYPVSLEVTAGMKTTVAALSYEFDFLQSDKYELGVTGGIHNLQFNFHIAAAGGGQNAAAESTAKANGPLPVVGMHGVWRLGEKWFFDAGAQFFRINIDPYAGRVTDYSAAFTWQVSPHFGLGAGWNSFVTKVDVNGTNFDGTLRWSYGGARIFASASF